GAGCAYQTLLAALLRQDSRKVGRRRIEPDRESRIMPCTRTIVAQQQTRVSYESSRFAGPEDSGVGLERERPARRTAAKCPAVPAPTRTRSRFPRKAPWRRGRREDQSRR